MITLRILTDSDIPVLSEILSCSQVRETYMIPEFSCPEEAYPLARRLAELSQEEARFVRGIWAGTQLAGFLNDVETGNGTIELGYVIHPRFWGSGYATAALKLAIHELFRLGWQEVAAGAFEENPASIRVMEKAGMQRLEKEDWIEYRNKQHRCLYYSIRA